MEEGVIDDGGTCFRVGMTEFHGGVVVVDGTIDTTHHTLIISEEEDGKTSNTIDGDKKATLLIPVDDIGPRNDIHCSGYPESFGVDRIITEDIRTGALLGFGEAKFGAKSGRLGMKKERRAG